MELISVWEIRVHGTVWVKSDKKPTQEEIISAVQEGRATWRQILPPEDPRKVEGIEGARDG